MTYQALYREWRPQTFEEVVGQEHITRTLQNAIKTGRIGHAYLFCGIRGTGKTSTAKILAKALNCEHGPTPVPCNECVKCAAINRGILMDVMEIDAASNRGIDEIRNLRDKIGFAPADGRYKVYIIDEVHMLTNEAFNALLKTLEEPPAFVVFILATTEPHKLPATILSRCQRFDFKRLSARDIYGRLKKICTHNGYMAEDSALAEIAKNTDGAMRDAISVMDQCISYANGKVSLDTVLDVFGTVDKGVLWDFGESIINRDALKAFKTIDGLSQKGKNLKRFVSDLLVHFRDLMVYKVSGSSEIIDAEPQTLERLASQSGRFSMPELVRIIKRLSELEQDMRWSDHPRVLLEMCVARFVDPKLDDSPESLLSRIEVLEQVQAANEGAGAVHEKPKSISKSPKENRRVTPMIEQPEDEIELKPTIDGKSPPKAVPEPAGVQEHESPSAPQPKMSDIWSEIISELNKTKKGLCMMLQESGAYPELSGDSAVKLVVPGGDVYLKTAEKDKSLLEKAFSDKLNKKVIVSLVGTDAEKKNPPDTIGDSSDDILTMVDDVRRFFGEDKVIVLEGDVEKFLIPD
jgi:DNA polymerase-3 subunit gamma/tau